ncbi:MAG TPA: four helix bundle protein [Gemmataceae bacterium]
MAASDTTRTFDLEERTFRFAQRVRFLIKQVPRTMGNVEDGKQVLRASGSVGANYIEANEALSNKNFLMRIKISRKEAKESHYWLRLIDLETKQELETERAALIQEADELTRIFGAIYRKSSS